MEDGSESQECDHQFWTIGEEWDRIVHGATPTILQCRKCGGFEVKQEDY